MKFPHQNGRSGIKGSYALPNVSGLPLRWVRPARRGGGQGQVEAAVALRAPGSGDPTGDHDRGVGDALLAEQAEQARILRLLIARIDVVPDGISVTLHVAGIRSLVAELTSEAGDDLPEAAD